MPYENEGETSSLIEKSTKQTEIQSVLGGIRNSNEMLHKTIEQLMIRLNSVLRVEPESKEAEIQPSFITKLAQQFEEENWKIKTVTRKIKSLIARLEI